MGSGILVLNQQRTHLVDADGNLLTLDDGDAIGSAEGILVAGKDGATGRFIRVGSDGTVRIDPVGTTTQPVSVSSLPLPSGAATESTLAACQALLSTIDADTGSIAAEDFATEATLANVATEAKLEAVRALLATIDADTSNLDVALSTRATETTLDAVRDNLGEATASPAANTLQDRVKAIKDFLDAEDFSSETTLAALKAAFDAEDFASETTLAAADTKLGTIDAVLDSIKDTDGIKKITDQLPAGTNEVGAVAQGTKAAAADAWPTALYDASGNPIAVVLDNSIYRLESRSTLVGQVEGAGAEVKVTTIADIENSAEQRLQTEARLAPGSTINIGTSIPADPQLLIVNFLENGGNEDMLVDGSSTPVVFSYSPAVGKVDALQELLIVFTADDFGFDGVSFGPNTALTNGILIEVMVDSVNTPIFNLKQNEDWIRIPGRIPLVNNTGPKDLLGVSFQFGGLIKLRADDGDMITVTVRDDLTSVKFKYLTSTIYATEEV